MDGWTDGRTSEQWLLSLTGHHLFSDKDKETKSDLLTTPRIYLEEQSSLSWSSTALNGAVMDRKRRRHMGHRQEDPLRTDGSCMCRLLNRLQ